MCDVDPLGQQKHELIEAQRRSIMRQFLEWSQRLKLEGAKHKLWLTEVEAFDSKRDSNLQRLRNNLALKKNEAVAELCDAHYCSLGFDKKQKALTYLKSRLVKVADLPPARSEGNVLRLLWADMAQLGPDHSHHTAEILEFFQAACVWNPDSLGASSSCPTHPSQAEV